MNKVAGILVDGNNKVVFYNTNGLILNEKDFVVLETERGIELGNLIFLDIKNKDVTDDMPIILRKASKHDIDNYNKNKEEAVKALFNAKKIANKHKLNMKIINASYTLDRSQLLFNFTSDARVDFREMAKELASIYKTRIELRQVGARDKAKEVSGIGQCGRELCCSCFLKDLDSVSINMAKNQNLSLNPSKINGQCGRLLCCLNYEDDVYKCYKNGMPNVGDEVKTESGIGKVISIDILKRSYVVNIPDHGKVEINLKDDCNEKCC